MSDNLEQLFQRRQRVVGLPAASAAVEQVPPHEVTQLPATTPPPGEAPPPAPRARISHQTKLPVTKHDLRPETVTDEPTAGLMVRVRRSLDDRLTDLLHELRKEGIRSSKVELIEMLLWELPAAPHTTFRERLRVFRRKASRTGDEL